MNELISVIMCTYNETKEELKAAIQSVLNQTYSNLELLIVLDNPDNTLIRDICQEYEKQDDRVRVIENKVNLGVALSSNRGLEYAKGIYIAKMDADDIALPCRLELELKVLKERKLDMVAASKINIDEEGKPLGEFINNLDSHKLRYLLPYDNLITQSTVLIKKSVIDSMEGYMPLPSCEDYDLWLRMLCKGYKMAIIPDVLVYYRVRNNSITRTDYYKQYLSDKFVRKMYQIHKCNDTLWCLVDYENYIKNISNIERKRERFNKSYRIYYMAMESRKKGDYGKFLRGIMISVMTNSAVLGVLIRKIFFHMRKKRVMV